MSDPQRSLGSVVLRGVLTGVLTGVLALLAPTAAAGPQNPIERVSVASGGRQADGSSYYGTLSGDGRYVAFSSDAENLVPGDANGVYDVFRHDRLTGRTIRASVSSSGAEGDALSSTSYLNAISDDGRYVAFTSAASNLVPGDANGLNDVFVRDVVAGTTERVSVGPAGREADGASEDASISADGSRVVFTSGASNLIDPPVGVNPRVYVRDRATGLTRIASVTWTGEPADFGNYPAISGDGRWVAFLSTAPGIVPGQDPGVIAYRFYLHDLVTGATSLGVTSPSIEQAFAFAGYQSLSHDGSVVAFWSDAPDLVPGDANGTGDAFCLDRNSGQISLVSRSTTGQQGDALIAIPRMSGDGRFVAFTSQHQGLVPGDTNAWFDAFVHDRATGSTTRISVTADGEPGLPPSHYVVASPTGLSADGRFVAFASNYRNLVRRDSNRLPDVFVVDRASPIPSSYCESRADSLGCKPSIGSSGTPSPSASASFVVRAGPVRNRRLGLLLYGLGPDRAPLGGGVLCLAPPLRRSAPLDSRGNPGGSDCSGALSVDFNERIRSGVDPDLVPGTVVYAQFLYRDAPGTALGMSDALRFAIQP